MIWTPFLFSSFLSILSKGENNDLEGKSSHLPYFLAPQKQPKWPKNEARETNLLPCGQTALATVWNVRSGHGIHQNLRETYTLLMVPCWVRYDNYRGRYRHFAECHRLAIAPCIQLRKSNFRRFSLMNHLILDSILFYFSFILIKNVSKYNILTFL